MRSKQGLMLTLKEMFHPERGISVEQLPSASRNVPHQLWTIEPAIEYGSDEESREGEVYEVCRLAGRERSATTDEYDSRLAGRCLARSSHHPAWRHTVRSSFTT